MCLKQFKGSVWSCSIITVAVGLWLLRFGLARFAVLNYLSRCAAPLSLASDFCFTRRRMATLACPDGCSYPPMRSFASFSFFSSVVNFWINIYIIGVQWPHCWCGTWARRSVQPCQLQSAGSERQSWWTWNWAEIFGLRNYLNINFYFYSIESIIIFILWMKLVGINMKYCLLSFFG